MGQGRGVRNTGFTDLARLINADPEKGITAGQGCRWVSINPIYEMLDTHYLRKERDMSIYDGQSQSPLKTEDTYKLPVTGTDCKTKR